MLTSGYYSINGDRSVNCNRNRNETIQELIALMTTTVLIVRIKRIDENNNGEFPILAIELHSMPIIILSSIICSSADVHTFNVDCGRDSANVCLKIHKQNNNLS